jgi:hypothetical protein
MPGSPKVKQPATCTRRMMKPGISTTRFTNGLARDIARQFKASSKSYTGLTTPGQGVLTDLTSKFIDLVVSKAIKMADMKETKKATSRKMLSTSGIRAALLLTAPIMIPSTTYDAWVNTLGDMSIWARATNVMGALYKRMAAQHVDKPYDYNNSKNGLFRLQDIYIRPTLMAAYIRTKVPNNRKMDMGTPIALALAAALFVELILRTMEASAGGMKVGSLLCPKDIFKAVETNQILKILFKDVNVVGVPVGLRVDKSPRKKRLRKESGGSLPSESPLESST